MARKVELVDAAQDDVVDLHGVGRRERWTERERGKSFSIKESGNGKMWVIVLDREMRLTEYLIKKSESYRSLL